MVIAVFSLRIVLPFQKWPNFIHGLLVARGWWFLTHHVIRPWTPPSFRARWSFPPEDLMSRRRNRFNGVMEVNKDGSNAMKIVQVKWERLVGVGRLRCDGFNKASEWTQGFLVKWWFSTHLLVESGSSKSNAALTRCKMWQKVRNDKNAPPFLACELLKKNKKSLPS